MATGRSSRIQGRSIIGGSGAPMISRKDHRDQPPCGRGRGAVRRADDPWRRAAGDPILARMSDVPSLTDVARVAADDFRRRREAVIDATLGRELAAAIELALLTAVRAERRAC